MRGNTVYLAGPITGLDYEGCTNWRDDAIRKLDAVGIRGLSPMRAKDALKAAGVLKANPASYEALSILATSRGIMTRDRNDCTTCDVLLVNLLGATRPSIGTIMEIAWADLKRIPIVCIIEKDGSNVHEHGMINEAIGYPVETLAEALHVVETIIAPNPAKWLNKPSKRRAA